MTKFIPTFVANTRRSRPFLSIKFSSHLAAKRFMVPIFLRSFDGSWVTGEGFTFEPAGVRTEKSDWHLDPG
jgi:hypothetical protein